MTDFSQTVQTKVSHNVRNNKPFCRNVETRSLLGEVFYF